MNGLLGITANPWLPLTRLPCFSLRLQIKPLVRTLVKGHGLPGFFKFFHGFTPISAPSVAAFVQMGVLSLKTKRANGVLKPRECSSRGGTAAPRHCVSAHPPFPGSLTRSCRGGRPRAEFIWNRRRGCPHAHPRCGWHDPRRLAQGACVVLRRALQSAARCCSHARLALLCAAPARVCGATRHRHAASVHSDVHDAHAHASHDARGSHGGSVVL